MKRWSEGELDSISDLKFAACILNERRGRLNPYSPLAKKLASAVKLIKEVDDYSRNGTGLMFSAEEIVYVLYRDGYHTAAKLIESMMMQKTASARQRELLNNCFGYITKAASGGKVLQTLHNDIGLTDGEIQRYGMGWILEEDGEEAENE